MRPGSVLEGLPRRPAAAPPERTLPLRAFPHGSPLGFALGCRSRGGCRWHGSAVWLTCAEARSAAVGDARTRRLPAHVPVPRRAAERDAAAVVAGLRHGTPYGYRRGCRSHTACPNAVGTGPTCLDAIRAYRQDYRSRRAAGAGAPVAHGTVLGYHAGCRRPSDCPGGADGLSCADARRTHRLQQARSRGVPSRALEDAGAAAIRLASLRADGLSGREIARRVGIGRTAVAMLLAALDRGETPTATPSTITRVLAAA